MMSRLNGRVRRLEAAAPGGCAACDERARALSFAEDTPAGACPECGRPIEVERFTIRIDRAEPRQGDAS